jgi:uncharacterized repeat protein (TIGR01451 family)
VLTATVTSGATGKVTFYDGTTILGVGTISGAQASLSTVMLPSGTQLLRAHYSGDSNYAVSNSANLPQTVTAGTSLGFRKAVNYLPTVSVNSIAVGDFNSDGIQDVVTTDGVTISVFLGKGDGTLPASVSYTLASAVRDVAVGDFNGDGKMDLAVTYSSTNIGVLLGNGDGSFQTVVNYPVAVSGGAIAVGDFNGDGKADLVVAASNYTYVNILLGNGDGSFQAPAEYSVGPGGPASFAVGDFNGDGKADIAVATADVAILLGNGDGTFATAVHYAVGSTDSLSIAAGDLNGDGKIDLVVATYYNGVQVLLGNGDGTFLTAVSYPAVNYSDGLVIADFNGDGNLDVATASSDGGFRVLLGNGDGSLQAPLTYLASTESNTIAVADLNGDGKADLLVAGGYDNGFNVLLGGAIPDLAIAVSHDGGFTEGQFGATYTITITNVGDIASSGPVGVVATLPANLTATSLTGAGWTCTVANSVCTRSDSLAAGASFLPITLRLNVTNGVTGNITSTFIVSGGNDQNSANNTASDTSFVRLSTATTLAVSPNPSVLGHAVTLRATVTAGATGNVAFYAGTTALGYATLSGGQAALTTYALPSGPSSLRAQYAGDSQYGPSTSAVKAQTVTAVATNGFGALASYKIATPQFIFTGDFNGDGKPDLVTIGNSTISVLPGKGDGTFGSAITSPLPSANCCMSAAVVGDFNGDGKPDVVVSNSNSGLYVLLGNGDGSFQTAVLASSAPYNFVTAADFNRDGILDLAAVYNGSVFFLAGNGDGSFQPAATIATNLGNTYSLTLMVGDVDGDGNPDLITSAPAVLLGNGDGTFLPPVAATAYTAGSAAYAVGDFNADGKTDLAVVTWDNIKALLSNGTATLQAAITTQLGFQVNSVAIAGDFNGDGKLDVAANGYGNDFYLIFGNGDGTFQSSSYGEQTQIAADGNIVGMVQGDFNGDGKPDLAVATSAGTVDIYLGGQYSGLSIAITHNGNFTSGQTGSYQITVQNPSFAATNGAVTVTDTLPYGLTATAISGSGWTCTLSTVGCNRSDGLNDNTGYPAITVAVSVAGLSPGVITNRVSAFYGGVTNLATDPTTIVLPTTTLLIVSPNPSTLSQTVTLMAVVTAGATGTVLFCDGGLPLGSAAVSGAAQASFTTSSLPSGLHSLTAAYSGDSTHAPSVSTIQSHYVNASQTSGFSAGSTYATGAGPAAIVAGDFNQDGKADLATANSTANTVSVLLNNGNGAFGVHTDFPVGTKPVAIVVGDFNNDGKTDIAVANQTSNNVSVLLGNGDGTFQAAVNYTTGNGPNSLAVGDLNSDGKIDLVVGNGSDGSLTLLFGNGDGTFRTAASPISAYGVSGVAIGDFNRDGKADLAYIYEGYSMYVLPGNGDGTFGSWVFIDLNSVSAMTLGDLNSDGYTDIVTAGSSGVSVVLGNGDGTFKSNVSYATPYSDGAVTLADINGDRKLDVVTVNGSNNSISVLLGNGDGTLQAAVSYPVGTTPIGVVASDFNGDGRTDLAIANSGGNNVSVFLGVLTPVFSIASQHASSFSLGQTGATYTLTLTNEGPGTPAGTVTVADILPAGFTATAISGTGWNCTLATVSCTRTDSLAVGAMYPSIVVTVNVTSSSATGTVVNQVNASGGGAVSATTFDPSTVNGPTTTIQTSPSGLQFTVDGGAALTSPQTLSLSPGAHTVAAVTPQPGPARSQYAFTGWSDAPTASRTITVGTVAATYTASFKTQYQLTATINPWPGGTVTPTSGTYIDAGSSVTLAAIPTAPYIFTSWSGDASGAANPVSFTMNAAKSVTATFNVPGFTCNITGDTSPGVPDLQLIINEALGLANPQHDLNHDNVVNVGDVQKLLNAVLQLGCPY